ncbi:hypothetical protein ACFYTS_17230 [Nocardia sp. NPDC004151]|uniref:hypothetical protein n=1 Tax=Nocardia sp. NPDC004151 TaxID=3364304 RepID=UPI0036CF0748
MASPAPAVKPVFSSGVAAAASGLVSQLVRSSLPACCNDHCGSPAWLLAARVSTACMPTHAERRAAAAAGDSDDPGVVDTGWVVVDTIVVLGWSDALLLEPHPVRASAASTAVTLADMAFTDT